MTTALLNEQEAFEIKEQWLHDVSALNRQVSLWLEQDTATPEITFVPYRNTEPPLPLYEIPLVEAAYVGEGQVALDEAVRNYPGHGQVTLIHWQTLRRVRLIHNVESRPWTVYTDSDIPLRQEWNQDNFLQLVKDLRAGS